MKINSKRLRQIVKEEIQYLQEFAEPPGVGGGDKELPPCPDLSTQGFYETLGTWGSGGGIADTLWDLYGAGPHAADLYKLIGLENDPKAQQFMKNYNYGIDKDGKRFERSKFFRVATLILASSKLGDGWSSGADYTLYAEPRDRSWAVQLFACKGASVQEMQQFFNAIDFSNMESTIREYHGKPGSEDRNKMEQHAIKSLPSPSGTRYMQ